jgi:glycosyltransferase involved in cell wall biosynthesis
LDRRKIITVTVTNDLSYDQRMRRHSQIWVEAGYEVLLIGRTRSTSIPLSQEVFGQKRLSCWFQKGKLFYVFYNLRLFFFLFFTKADILVAVDLDTLLPNMLVAKLRGKILVFDSHEYYTEVPELIGRDGVKKVWDSIAKLCLPRVNLAYTVGEALAQELTQRYAKEFETIKNVPPLVKNTPRRSAEANLIVYQGALNKGRALEALIIAMINFEGKLLLVGEGDLSDSLRRLVQTENLNHKIEFTGWVKPSELPAITQKAWLGYNLLEPESKSYYFSLANKFFDYLHAGIPQFCPPFPEYERINKEFEVALLLEPNPENILNCLNQLKNDAALYENLQHNCSLAAEAYNLQIESKKLISLFQVLSN